MRAVAAVTVARSDYGLLRPVLRAMRDDPALTPRLLVAGAHLAPAFGETVREVEADGFPIVARVETYTGDDSPVGVARASGAATTGFAEALAALRPDLLLLIGDRYEMHAAAIAALPLRVPVAHVHGGESSEGAIDESLRHSLTKLSHLHFATTEAYARRIVQMGEEPWRVSVSGAPGLDELLAAEPVADAPADVDLLVTFHPETLDHDATVEHVRELLAAMAASRLRALFTYPGADTGARTIIAMIDEFVSAAPQHRAVPSLGTAAYATLLGRVRALVGNSSSGIIEAASFGLPVVNVGERQRGRLRGENVIDVGHGRAEILAGIERATDPAFRSTLDGMRNPYGDGRAAERIVARLRDVELGPGLLIKRFHDGEA